MTPRPRSIKSLARGVTAYAYGFLDGDAKRELRRCILKSIAIPGYQTPYASRELPIARGWGTGGLQVTLSLVGPEDTVKVIDQGADDSVNAVNLRRFIARLSGAATTTDTTRATLIQSRHRIPEERLTEAQTLILQVPDPEPLRNVQHDISKARVMHSEADYGLVWLGLYEQIVRYRRVTIGASYPVLVHGRYVMSPSPIPRWDAPKLHQSAHLTLLSAGREKRLYAVPPYTDVQPLAFVDVPFRIEKQGGWVCWKSGGRGHFMTEVPLPEGAVAHEISDTSVLTKLVKQEPLAPTYYDAQGVFFIDGVLHP